MGNNSKLQITQVAVNELRFSEYNPRRWAKEQLQKLKESIAKFGLVDPLIVNPPSVTQKYCRWRKHETQSPAGNGLCACGGSFC